MSIGKNIRHMRMQRNLTQEQLAEKINVSRPLITQVERGTKGLSVSTCKDIARALNCTIEEIIND